jgi:crossover junction endodeoxyribonuclease RuvC
MSTPIRVLGLDPGLRHTGWGVVIADGARLSYVAHGVISAPTDLPLSDRLRTVFDGVQDAIRAHAPAMAAIEETFVTQNGQSTLKLGHARAAAMLAAATMGLDVGEYAAREVKKAIVGTGAADKHQMQMMIQRLLPSAGKVPADAADALGVAIVHAQSHRMRALVRGAA